MGSISAPVYKAIRRWVWDGEIDDPHSVLIANIWNPNHATMHDWCLPSILMRVIHGFIRSVYIDSMILVITYKKPRMAEIYLTFVIAVGGVVRGGWLSSCAAGADNGRRNRACWSCPRSRAQASIACPSKNSRTASGGAPNRAWAKQVAPPTLLLVPLEDSGQVSSESSRTRHLCCSSEVGN